MKIYKQEQEANLAEAMELNNSVAYVVGVEKFEIPAAELLVLANKLNLKKFDEEIFYATKSILVTTTWNRNDDVFGAMQVWDARKTPINTFTNINHDHDEIVGHITETWAINEAGELIADDIDPTQLPDKFHICNSAVIYKFPRSRSQKAIARAEKLINEIESGKKFVSMECLFSDFDYAIISPENKYYVVARNEETSFLTKHLRIYGGEGSYNNYKIGRFLKNMVFSGKAYVDTPANPESIIFDNETEFSFAQYNFQDKWFDVKDKTTVYTLAEENINVKTDVSLENINMPIEDTTALQNQLKDAQATIADLQKQLSSASVEKIQEENTKLKSELTAAEDNNKSLTEEVSTAKTELEAAKSEVEALKVTNQELSDKIASAEQAQIRANRVSTLVEGGVEKVKAEEKVDLFASLNDEQFKVVADEILAAVAARKEVPAETTEANENADVNLDEVTTVEDGASAGALDTPSVDEEVAKKKEALMLGIAELVSAQLNIKPKK